MAVRVQTHIGQDAPPDRTAIGERVWTSQPVRVGKQKGRPTMQAIGHGRRFARANSATTRAEGLLVALTIHDAWWGPGSAESPLTPGVVTTHHQGYYGNHGNTPATGFNSPILNSQIAVQGSIEDPPVWLKLAERMLKTALTNRSAGAKTRAGYGLFRAETDPPRTVSLGCIPFFGLEGRNASDRKWEPNRCSSSNAASKTIVGSMSFIGRLVAPPLDQRKWDAPVSLQKVLNPDKR